MGGVRAEDRRNLAIGFLSLFALMAAHALSETARDALFLGKLDADQLPWAYLAIAGLALVVVRINQQLLQRSADKRKLLGASLLVAAVVDVGWGLAPIDAQPALLFALYVWTGLVATVIVVQFWLLLDDVVTVTQAKRIFGPVAAGGVVGALTGSFLADRYLAMDGGAQQLLFGASAFLVLGAMVPFAWKPEEKSEHEHRRVDKPHVEHGLKTLCSHAYLRRLLLMVLFSTVALTGADFLFKSVVEENIPPEQLATFFARFYVGLNAAALVVQVVLSGLILRVFGVNRALLVLPVLLLMATIGFAIVPILTPVLLLKGADGSLRHSLHRTAMEVLYLPVPRELRDRFKGLIDGVGQRGGQAIASLGILLTLSLGAEPEHIVWPVMALLVGWLVVMAGTRRSYLQLFRQSLRGGHVEGAGQLASIDLHSLEALLNALNSERDEEVVAALDLFQRYDKVDLIPKLVLYHPSPQVALRALEIFSQEGDPSFAPIARRLMRDEDSTLRSAALRALMIVDPDDRLLQDSVMSHDAALHATALVGMLGGHYPNRGELTEMLELCLTQGSPEVQAELARAIAHQPDPDSLLLATLGRLGESGDEEVVKAAVEAMSVVPNVKYFDFLVPMLGDSTLRPVAREALVAMGEPALELLDKAMNDRRHSRRVRRHLPRTISRFRPDLALEILQRHLPKERDGAVRYKILRGLVQLIQMAPTLQVDRTMLQGYLKMSLSRVVEMMDLRVAVKRHRVQNELDGLGGELLIATLKEKERNALQRAFQYMSLLDPEEDYALIWRNLRSTSPKIRAAARELLDHALRGNVRETVLALVEDGTAPERLQRAAPALGMALPDGTYEDRLAMALVDSSDGIRSLVAYHIAELGLTGLEPSLRDAQPEKRGFVREVMERALQTLTGPGGVPSVA